MDVDEDGDDDDNDEEHEVMVMVTVRGRLVAILSMMVVMMALGTSAVDDGEAGGREDGRRGGHDTTIINLLMCVSCEISSTEETRLQSWAFRRNS